ncbi:hypothetical protein UY3_00221 [Chelonia mydas]|uniref:Uncharacterized protein n=1 Tax=Chelonia mydas TaxID=8469 RepID=M7CMN6_CHEMY|nr:hypothetical protein UY3_00221 [Chelonia mydas]
MEKLQQRPSESVQSPELSLISCTAVLLGLGTQPVWGIEDNSLLPTGINEEALTRFLIHVKRGMSGNPQYAVATLLSCVACKQTAIAEPEGATIQDKLLDVLAKGTLDRAAYVNKNNLLVSLLQRDEYMAWHPEAVLVGTMDKYKYWGNFLKDFLAANREQYPPNNSCFIFFSLISPCLDYCLNPDSPTYILSDLQHSLQGFDPHFQAFAFKYASSEDTPKGQTRVWKAWCQIPMPLFHFSFDPPSCTRCRGTLGTNECLDDISLFP